MSDKSGESFQDSLNDWLVSIIVAVALAFCIRTFIFEPYKVEGTSMYPTLFHQERLIVNKIIYFLEDPKRNEIVVFRYPKDESRDFIKRVIGVEGDTIEIKDGKVYLNDELLDESYILEPTRSTFPKRTIPSGHIFVMGDNRNNSEDSRFRGVGFLPLDMVKGKAMMVFWPLDSMKMLP